MKRDVIRKLTSRKLWLAVASFVSMLAVALGMAQGQAEKVAALIMAGASVLSYVLAEGWADAAGAGKGSAAGGADTAGNDDEADDEDDAEGVTWP